MSKYDKPLVSCQGCGEERPNYGKGLCSICYKEQAAGKRQMEGAYAGDHKITRDIQTGRPQCRWCKQPVPKGKRTFCGDECVHEWRMRTSPQYVRMKVFERDQGVCLKCGLDTPAMELRLTDIFIENRDAYDFAWTGLLDKGFSRNRRHGLWDADHIQSIRDGGGLCGMDNYRTLCIPCHKEETKKLHKRMAVERKAGRDPEAIPHGVEWEPEEVDFAKVRAAWIRMMLKMDIITDSAPQSMIG